MAVRIEHAKVMKLVHNCKLNTTPGRAVDQ